MDEKHEDILLQLHIERPLYEQEALNEAFSYERPQGSCVKHIKTKFRNNDCKSTISTTIPIINWLRKYKWKNEIVSDIISGITVAIMHIPQGMAYAMLGNLPPVVGIYMAIFPVLIYFLFGTSKHVSMGTFAVVCLMTGKAVTLYSIPFHEDGTYNLTTINDKNLTINNSEDTLKVYTPIQVATAVTLMVGFYQILMYIFRLGIISTLLSETLVNSFTTGAAVYVAISQIKDLLGLKLPKQRGYFKLIFTVIDVLREISHANLAAVTISIVAIFLLIANNEFLKPWITKKCNMPIPIELIAVITGTIISRYCSLPEIYNIPTVGHIPTGFPKPEIPTIDLLSVIAIDSIAITMVSYTITISMAIILAQKDGYKINSNQELLAMGLSNVAGSFFSCMPISASLSRSLIQQSVGGRTQIASVVSCVILSTILLWVGPFFESLPRCVLASIIVVALKGMFLQAIQLIKFWKLNKCDAVIWIATFLVVIIVNIDVGLLVGLLTSILVILFQSIKPYICLLGHIPNSDLYLDINRYKAATEIPGIKIIYYCGSLNFANSNYFKSEIYRLINVEPHKIIKHRTKLMKRGLYLDQEDADEQKTLQYIILDLSAVSYIDPSSVNILHSIITDYLRIQVPLYLAGCSSPVYDTIKKCDTYTYGELSMKIFATIQDALVYARKEMFSR